VFIQVYKKGKTVYATTEDLASLAQLNTNAVQEVYLLTGAILEDLVAVLRNYIGVLLKMADAIALLDMLRSFAHQVSLSDSFCRPEFAEGPLAIRQGRHPMAASFLKSRDFVPNNTMIHASTASFNIITGPNMAGKSSYIKQVALITILSHIGCFVPAEYVHMPPIDKIFARVGTSDSILGNASTFFLEMQEMAVGVCMHACHACMLACRQMSCSVVVL
jgi:DNA mismatch repair protein MSH4